MLCPTWARCRTCATYRHTPHPCVGGALPAATVDPCFPISMGVAGPTLPYLSLQGVRLQAFASTRGDNRAPTLVDPGLPTVHRLMSSSSVTGGASEAIQAQAGTPPQGAPPGYSAFGFHPCHAISGLQGGLAAKLHAQPHTGLMFGLPPAVRTG